MLLSVDLKHDFTDLFEDPQWWQNDPPTKFANKLILFMFCEKWSPFVLFSDCTRLLSFLTPIWLVILMNLIRFAICGYFRLVHVSSVCIVINWLLLEMRFLLLAELLTQFCLWATSLHRWDRDWAFGQWSDQCTAYNDGVFNSNVHLAISVVRIRCLSFDLDVSLKFFSLLQESAVGAWTLLI